MGDFELDRRHGGRARSEPGATTRILIALGGTYLRRGIEARLGAEADFEVVATPDDGPSAVAALVEAAPAVVLIDDSLPAPGGFETVPRIKRELPSAAIIVLAETDDADSLFAAIRSGAAALLGPAARPDELVATIRRVAAGAYLINDLVATKPVVAGRVLDEFRRLLVHDPAAAPIFRPLSP